MADLRKRHRAPPSAVIRADIATEKELADEAEAAFVIETILTRADARVNNAIDRRRGSVKIDTDEAWLLVRLAESSLRRLRELHALNVENDRFFAALRQLASSRSTRLKSRRRRTVEGERR